MTRIILLTALLASPAFAGGPVILETEPAPVTSDQRPCIIGCLALAVIVIGAAVLMGGDNCNSGEPTDGGKC